MTESYRGGFSLPRALARERVVPISELVFGT
jgi:hypothetical protein